MRRPSKKGVGKTQAPPVDDDTIKRVRRYLLTQRPKNYDKLPARKQWEIDKRLGLLDTEE
jgi:hypothetical protein